MRLRRRELLELLGGAAAVGMLPACTPDAPAPPPLPATEPETIGSLHYASLTEIAGLLKAGEISPVELTEMMLERIEGLDRTLKSFATVTADRALQSARIAEREIASGSYRGPLHGVPIAVKDLCYTRGVRTMGGLAVLKDFVPTFDATVVTRLEDAGAVLLGKLNLTEGAMGGYHRDFDIPVNPWDSQYWSGASSSGSGVATAAGLCFASLGSDTGGSIRFPSMANGIVGLKPTYGRVSRHGVIPLGETLDHVGPMTRRTADAAIVLEAIAGHDADDPTSLDVPAPDMRKDLGAGIEGLRIGYDPRFSSEGIDAGLVASIEQALETLKGLGAVVVDVGMPEGTEEIRNLWFPLCSYEAFRAHAENFPSRADEYGPFIREFLQSGAAVTDAQYAGLTAQRMAFNQQFNAVLAQADAVVCPAGGTTFPIEPDIQYGDTAALQAMFEAVQMYFTMPADLAGTPALTVPCGFSENGIPYGLQFMGQRLSEPLLCRIGHAYEEATEWHKRHPPV